MESAGLVVGLVVLIVEISKGVPDLTRKNNTSQVRPKSADHCGKANSKSKNE